MDGPTDGPTDSAAGSPAGTSTDGVTNGVTDGVRGDRWERRLAPRLVPRRAAALAGWRALVLMPVTLSGYRYERGDALRRFRTYRAHTWRELTARTHGWWVDEGDGFEYRVRREELELRTRDGARVHRYDHHPREVSALRPARDPWPRGIQGPALVFHSLSQASEGVRACT